ncbi:MAG: TetR/AcrR family transcriptional regulator [Clostridiales bacterium]|nr:TetR/AcrR family transcriptional regulator [Clostridiales bacterium]
MKTMNRTEKRKLETREHIKAVAIEMLKQSRSTELKMEQVALKADISRKTIYNHFSNKENLLSDIINPILSFCIESVKEIDVKTEINISDITDLCIKFYNMYGSKLNLMYNIDFKDLHDSYDLHKEYTQLFIGLFKKIDDLSYTQIEYRQAAFIVFKTFVPLLNTLSNNENKEALFSNAIYGLLRGLE